MTDFFHACDPGEIGVREALVAARAAPGWPLGDETDVVDVARASSLQAGQAMAALLTDTDPVVRASGAVACIRLPTGFLFFGA